MVSKTSWSEGRCRFVIRPNRSLTWRQQKLFFALMVAVTMTIAGSFAWLGYWPVLPFAGLELAVLALALWLCATTGAVREVVSVAADRLVVDRGRRRLRRVWEAHTAWAQVRLLQPRIAWYPTRLVIRSHGEEVQLGGFLNEEERQYLAGELVRALARAGT